MKTFTHDRAMAGGRGRLGRGQRDGSQLVSGLAFAIVSAASFGMSGALARGLLDTGWSAGAAVLVRLGLAAVVMSPFAVMALRGRWLLLRRNAGLLVAYGLT